MKTFQEFRENSGLVQLRASSSVEEITAVLMDADTLPHWFDRQRALESIAHRVGVGVELLSRLEAEVTAL